MTPKFNYISLLAIFSLPALTVFFTDIALDTSITYSFGYLLYLGYIKTPMDELFLTRVQQAASVTLLFIAMVMSGVFISVFWVESVDSFIITSYWMVFLLMHVAFNVILTAFLVLDSTRSNNA